MGSGKKRIQSMAEGRATQTKGAEDIAAQEFKDRLPRLRAMGEETAVSGGYEPGQLGTLRSGFGEFAATGGLSPEDRENFIRRATGVVPAMYERQKDELSRRLALQGGYMPGFTSSQSKLTRHGAQEGAKATLDAQTQLAEQIRQGRFAGLAGMRGLESDVAGGRRSAFGMMSETEKLDLANRLSAMGASEAEIRALLGISGQKRGALDTALDTIDTASGAVGAVAGAFGAGGGKKP